MTKVLESDKREIHNQEVQNVFTDEIVADEMWSFVQKNRNSVVPGKLIAEIAG